MFYDYEAEKRVLGGILLDPDLLSVVLDICTADAFHRDIHQTMFRAMESMASRNVPIDAVTVAEFMSDSGHQISAVEVSHMLDVPSSANAEYSARRVADLHRKRLINRTLNQYLLRMDEDRQESSETLLPDLLHDLDDIHATKQADVVLWPDALDDGATRIEKYRKGVLGHQSGLTDLDRKLHGFEAGDYIILAANSSHGKTSLMMDLVRRFGKQDIPVLIISLETEAARLASRGIASELDTPLKGFSGKPDVEAFKKYPIYIRDAAKIHNYKAFVQRMVHLYGIELVFIDHLQIFTQGKTDSRVTALENISLEVKATTKDLNLVTVALSQVTGCDDRLPRMDDIRWNKDIQHHADKVMTFAHLGKLSQGYINNLDIGNQPLSALVSDPERATLLLIDKNRDGPTGYVLLYSDLSTFTYNNLQREE